MWYYLINSLKRHPAELIILAGLVLLYHLGTTSRIAIVSLSATIGIIIVLLFYMLFAYLRDKNKRKDKLKRARPIAFVAYKPQDKDDYSNNKPKNQTKYNISDYSFKIVLQWIWSCGKYIKDITNYPDSCNGTNNFGYRFSYLSTHK